MWQIETSAGYRCFSTLRTGKFLISDTRGLSSVNGFILMSYLNEYVIGTGVELW